MNSLSILDDIEVIDLRRQLLFLFVSISLLLFSFNIVNASMGIQKGDWFEYSVTWSGTPPTTYYAVGLRGEAIYYEPGYNMITIKWETELNNGEITTYTEVTSLEDGALDFRLIPANSEIGDVLPNEYFDSIDIDGTEEYAYAGEERTLLWAIEDIGTFHWDKETGIQVQYDSEVDGVPRKILLEKTSLWETNGESIETGLDLTLIVGLVVAVVAILLIVLLILRKRKKTTEKP